MIYVMQMHPYMFSGDTRKLSPMYVGLVITRLSLRKCTSILAFSFLCFTNDQLQLDR